MRGRIRIVAVIVLAVALVQTGGRADAASVGCSASDPFTAVLEQQLAATWPSQHFTAYVYDQRTHCEYSLHPTLRIGTASVLKVEVMAGILLRAQNEGRDLTQWERDRIWPMITQSADAPTNDLWQSLGGGAGMADLDGTFGLTETTPASPVWGLTTTSARDQVHLLRQVLLGEFGPMQYNALSQAWAPMLSVVPEQRWGVTAGVPAGWPVAQKNGFASSSCCLWRINSTGVVVNPAGGAYAVTILSDEWPTEDAGIQGVEFVSRAIAAKLTHPTVDITSGIYDRDGDHRADPVVVGDGDCPAQQHWYWAASAVGFVHDVFGGRQGGCDTLLTGDVDGDGRADTIAVRPDSNGDLQWFAQRSSDGGVSVYLFGRDGDVVLMGDYDGDGRSDPAVMRPGHGGSNHTWYIDRSSGGVRVTPWGNSGFEDTPVTGDYDGDGRTDIAVTRRASNGDLAWYIEPTARTVYPPGYRFGRKGDVVVPGDWLGDKASDLAVVRADDSSGNDLWFALSSAGSLSTAWGRTSDWVMPADYDGDGHMDNAVWRADPDENGAFWIRRSSDGGLTQLAWGVGGRDHPPFSGSVFTTSG